MFPGVFVHLNLGTGAGTGGSQGSVVNHVGFIVNNVQEQVAKWKAAGIAVLPGGNNRLDQAYVETPDGLRMEILEDKTQSMPIRHEHVHLFLQEAEIPKAQAWYAKTFGGKAGTRNNAPVVDVPGAQIRFAKADMPQARTLGRVLDHIGFDVKDLKAFITKIEGEGIKLDEPYRETPTGNAHHLHHRCVGHPHRADQAGSDPGVVGVGRQEAARFSKRGVHSVHPPQALRVAVHAIALQSH